MSSVAATDPGHNSGDGHGHLLTTPQALTEKIRSWREQGFHVLAPSQEVMAFAPGYGVNAAMVWLDHRVDDGGRGITGDVYYDRATMGEHMRGLAKNAFARIASATGTSWVHDACGRKDPLTIQNLWIYAVLGVYLAYDGTPQTIHGEKEIDYRDGSEQIGGWTLTLWHDRVKATLPVVKNDPSAAAKSVAREFGGWSHDRVRRARMNGAERSETGAMERALRMGFALRHTYSVAELSKPFVALRVQPLIDMNDPEMRRLVTAGKLSGVAALYRQSRLPGGGTADVIDIASRRQEPVPVGASATPAAAAPAPAVPAPVAPSPAAPPTPAPEAPRSTPRSAPEAVAAPAAAPTAPAARPAPPQSAGLPGVLPKHYIREIVREPKTYSQGHAKAGQPFTKYHVIDGDGVEHTTIKSKLAQLATNAHAGQQPVVIVSVPNKFREMEIVSIEPYSQAAVDRTTPTGGYSL